VFVDEIVGVADFDECLELQAVLDQFLPGFVLAEQFGLAQHEGHALAAADGHVGPAFVLEEPNAFVGTLFVVILGSAHCTQDYDVVFRSLEAVDGVDCD